MIFSSKLTLLFCFLFHFQLLVGGNWVGRSCQGYIPIVFSLFQGMAYFLYPLCGWISEVFTSSFKTIKWSFVFALMSSATMCVMGLLLIVSPIELVQDSYVTVCGVVFIITGLIGLGMYEANAIQFGMDQMLEASSEQLGMFIHWYFWCASVGPLIIWSLFAGVSLYSLECLVITEVYGFMYAIGWILMIPAFIQVIIFSCGIFFYFLAPRCFAIQQMSRNPLKIIFKVLFYAFKHKYPERRSAFTYWENYIPSRIDLGKQKYGGPFTYEQVEDVKTMFRLLLLMVSLFGYHLSGDGFSLTYYIMNTMGCTTLGASLTMIWNPEHITLLVVVFGIPLYYSIKRYISWRSPSSLNRLWFGLLLCLVSECFQCNYSLLIEKREFWCDDLLVKKPSLLLTCIYANIKTLYNGSCKHFCSSLPVNDSTVYLSLIPFIINGLSYLLVFVTMVEFICAQSPNAMKGLLVGVWYSMLSIKYSLVENLDIHPFLLETNNWVIYHGIKGLGIFLSIVLFSLVYKYYKYRERDELVNEQAIIERQFERELLLNTSSESDNQTDIISDRYIDNG